MTTEQYPKAIFENIAELYEKTIVPRRMRQYKTLIDMLDIRGHEAVLDVGCGTGALTALLASRTSGRVVGVDASESMLRIAAERIGKQGLGNVSLMKLCVEELGTSLRGELFDIVVCSHVIHWLREPTVFFNAVDGLLKSGGRIGVIVASHHIYREIIDAIITVSQSYCPLSSYDLDTLLLNLVGRRHYSINDMRELFKLHGIKPVVSVELKEITPITPRECLEVMYAVTGGLHLRHSSESAISRFNRDLYEYLCGLEELTYTDHVVMVVGVKE